MVPGIQIWVVDQAAQNRDTFTGIKNESTLNIYVKCDGGYVKIWQYDGNRGGGGMPKYDGWWQPSKMYDVLYGSSLNSSEKLYRKLFIHPLGSDYRTSSLHFAYQNI